MKILKLPKMLLNFLRSTFVEVKKVTWLKRSDTFRFLFINIVFITFATLFIFLADQAFLSLRNLLI